MSAEERAQDILDILEERGHNKNRITQVIQDLLRDYRYLKNQRMVEISVNDDPVHVQYTTVEAGYYHIAATVKLNIGDKPKVKAYARPIKELTQK